MRHLLPLVFVFGLIGAACARRAEEPPAPEPVPVVAVAQPSAPVPVVAVEQPTPPAPAPVVTVEPTPNVAPRPALPVAPEPLPVAPGRTNGIGKRVVIDGVAVWVEAVEYKNITFQLETGEVRESKIRRLVISFGVQSTDPAHTFEYNTWMRYQGTMLVRDARGRGWGKAGTNDDRPTHTGNILLAITTCDKPVIDELMFFGHGKLNPPGSAEPALPDFTAYFDIDLPRPTLPFDESRMYRFRVRAPEIK